MKRMWLTVLSLAVMLVVAAICEQVQAQPGGQRGQRGGPGGQFGGGRGGPGGFTGGGFQDPTMQLLGMREVQEELDLLKEQVEDIQKVVEDARGGGARGGDRGGDRPNFQDMTEEEREKFIDDRRKQQEEQNEKVLAEVNKILFEDQAARLQELKIQRLGTAALFLASVQTELKISGSQKSDLEKAREKNGELMTSLFEKMRSGDIDRDSIRGEMEKSRGDADKNLLAVLSKDQQAEFEKMQGVKFEFPERQFGGPGRGRGGPGGGQQGARPQRGAGGQNGRPQRPGGGN